MSTIKVTVRQTLAGVEFENVFHYWNAATFASAAIIDEVLDDFVADVLDPLWRGWCPDEVAFVEIEGRAYDNPFPVTLALGTTGTQEVDPVVIKPPYMALIVKETISGNFDPVTGGVVLSPKPVRSGRKYITGLTEGFETMAGYSNPGGTIGDNFSLFLGALNDVRTGGGVNWTPIILGFPLPASGSTAARTDAIAAPVSGATPVRFTKLGSRLE